MHEPLAHPLEFFIPGIVSGAVKRKKRKHAGIPVTDPVSLLSLDFILDERLRELMWEGHRRTDLIRFGQFSDGDYVWAWKGGVKEGRQVASTFDLFPIPATDIGANPTLDQNPGY